MLLLAVYLIEILQCLLSQPKTSLATLYHKENYLSSPYCPVFSLYNSIMSRSVRCNQLVFNVCIFTKLVKFSKCVFSFIVRPYHLCFASTLSFNPSFKFLEDVNNLILKFYKINPTYSYIIINESNIKFIVIDVILTTSSNDPLGVSIWVYSKT